MTEELLIHLEAQHFSSSKDTRNSPPDYRLSAHSAYQQLQDFNTFWKPEGHVGFPHAVLQRLLEDYTKPKNDMMLLCDEHRNVSGVNPKGFYWKVSFMPGVKRVSVEKEVDWTPHTELSQVALESQWVTEGCLLWAC